MQRVYCHVCKFEITPGSRRVTVATQSFCTRDGTCIYIGERAAAWRLTATEARSLLHSDVGRFGEPRARRAA